MAELPSNPNSADIRDGESTTGTPRWVKMFGIIGIVLFVLLVVLHLTGHGPGHHTTPSNVIEHGMQSP